MDLRFSGCEKTLKENCLFTKLVAQMQKHLVRKHLRTLNISSRFTSNIKHRVSSWAYGLYKGPEIPTLGFQDGCQADTPECSDETLRAPLTVSSTTSEVVSNVFTNFHQLMRCFVPRHPEAAKLWCKLCHKIDASYPPKEKLQPIDINNEEGSALIADIQYNIRHAFLAYGPGLTGILQESLSLLFQSQARMLTECLNISAKDILMDTCSVLSNVLNKPHQPAFYLLLDHKRKKIVLSIRGTASIGDFINDLHWDCTKWSVGGITGYVYEGWLRAAESLHKSVTNTLVHACRQYSKYKVVITGHSMAGGVAGLLGLMYKDNSIIRGQNGKRLNVWCFAAPSVVSREFVDQKVGNDYITTVTLDTDAVSRISPEAFKIWNLRQELISEYSTDKIKDILRRDDISDSDEGAKLLRILKNVRSPNPEHELFSLGRILWFVPRVVLNDDIVFRRKTLMKMAEDHDDSITDDDSEEAVCGTISSDETSLDGASGSEGKQSTSFSEFVYCGDADNESLSEDEEDQKESFHQIRRRPMDQSSDEEDDDNEEVNDESPQSTLQNDAVQHNLFVPRHQLAMHSGDALIEELIKMNQDAERATKCTVVPKAYEKMEQIAVEDTASGIGCTDGHRTESKDDFQEDQIEGDEVQNMTMYRIRRRPMDQSSDEEDDDEEGATVECITMTPSPDDESPIMNGITGSMERLKSTVQTTLHLKIDDQRRERLQQSGYVLCDATEARSIFTEFIFEPKFLDLHMIQCYMWVCGATLKIED